MASTKRTISEAIKRRLSAGDPPVGSKVHHLEIDRAVMQVLNSLLRPQYFETLNEGGSEPEGFLLCTYDDVAVAAYKGVSKCTLPAIPANLLRNQGVHRVYNSDDVVSAAFIPATSGEFEMIASQNDILSDLLGQFAYKVRGKELIFNKDLTAQSPAIDEVSIELVVMDYSKFSDYELLPINADMEHQVIETVYQMFSTDPKPQTVDPTSDSKP